MLKYLQQEANLTVTENGAVAYTTTGSDCLDLFASIGALRREGDEEIITRFTRAFAENRDFAMKLLFFARDVRGGLSERRVFRVILRWLAENEPSTVKKNLAHVAEYGRYDDLLSLMGTPCEGDMLALVGAQLEADTRALAEDGEVSLLAKWLPSVNASAEKTVRDAKRIAKHLGLTDAAYRKVLVALRAHIRIIENHLRECDYTFDYGKQPSRAMHKYRKAFMRHDGERYLAFLDRVQSGEATLNTSALAPYEIVTPLISGPITAGERKSLDVTWQALEDFTGDENALVVVDGSGSMYWGGKPTPATVAFSLGIYFAERNTGAFHNHFITFSEKPRLVEIKGQDIYEKVRYCMKYNEVANTNLARVFDLILSAAQKHAVPNAELPRTLYIVSDMEFDECTSDASLSVFEYAKRTYAAAGYTLPKVVFWNVASRNGHQPVTMNEQGVALVSGCTPRIFSMVTHGQTDPYTFMLEVLTAERYAPIVA